MSAFKKLDRRDVFTTVHLAEKSWSTSDSDASNYGIEFSGGTSGSLPTFTGDSSFNELLKYRSIRQLYYSNYTNDKDLPTGSFENFLQSSLNSNSRSLSSSIAVVSFPRNVIGVGLSPGSLGFNIELAYIEDEGDYVLETEAAGGDYIEDLGSGAVTDDGEGKIISDENNFLGKNRGDVVGDIIYTHGIGVFTDIQFANYFANLSNPDLTWKSYYPIYTTTYALKVRDEEFNYSLNPSSMDNNGNIADNISGSEFKPYVTSIGLYNDDHQLIAVAKLGQPIPKSTDTDMTFVVKLDI